MSEPTPEQAQVTATVSPAPPPKSRWGAVPHHLGRARTSTVVLGVLFLAIGALWLNVRPDPDPPGSVVPLVGQTVLPPPTSDAPAPEPTAEPAPATSAGPAPTTEPPETAAPEVSTTADSPRATPTPTAPLPAPTGTPTG